MNSFNFFGPITMTLCRSAVFILRRNDIPVGKYTGQMAFRRSSWNIHPTVITLIFSHIFFLSFFVRIRIYFCSFDIVLVHLDFLELSMLLFMLFSSLVRRRPLSSPAWQSINYIKYNVQYELKYKDTNNLSNHLWHEYDIIKSPLAWECLLKELPFAASPCLTRSCISRISPLLKDRTVIDL